MRSFVCSLTGSSHATDNLHRLIGRGREGRERRRRLQHARPMTDDAAIIFLAACKAALGDLKPASAGHFHVAAAPGDKTLARVAARISPAAQTRSRIQRAGAASDPAIPSRRRRAMLLPRGR